MKTRALLGGCEAAPRCVVVVADAQTVHRMKAGKLPGGYEAAPSSVIAVVADAQAVHRMKAGTLPGGCEAAPQSCFS